MLAFLADPIELLLSLLLPWFWYNSSLKWAAELETLFEAAVMLFAMEETPRPVCFLLFLLLALRFPLWLSLLLLWLSLLCFTLVYWLTEDVVSISLMYFLRALAIFVWCWWGFPIKIFSKGLWVVVTWLMGVSCMSRFSCSSSSIAAATTRPLLLRIIPCRLWMMVVFTSKVMVDHVATLTLDLIWCKPLQVSNTGLKPFNTLLLSVWLLWRVGYVVAWLVLCKVAWALPLQWSSLSIWRHAITQRVVHWLAKKDPLIRLSRWCSTCISCCCWVFWKIHVILYMKL